MKITIVMGFFLPMPPAAGGATEKTWHELALEFVRRGHEVTILSRTWRGWPQSEVRDGVRHIRLKGSNHTSRLAKNLWLDFIWSLRAWRALPDSDVTVVNAVALPVFLGWFRGRSGRLVVMTGRMPKGQYRAYRRVDRVLAVSTPVRDAVIAENPGLGPVTRVFGYPIHWGLHASARNPLAGEPIRIGFVGRIHPEKGLDLFAAALVTLATRRDLPPWKAILCGPDDVARGGAGPAYAREIRSTLAAGLPASQFEILPAQFDERRLAEVYRSLDIFCYPSVSERGETFGVAVAEAMAAGVTPVVSALPCFRDFVEDGRNGLVFDHRGADAATNLCRVLGDLVASPDKRRRLGAAAQAAVRVYDYPAYADRLLAEFTSLGQETKRND